MSAFNMKRVKSGLRNIQVALGVEAGLSQGKSKDRGRVGSRLRQRVKAGSRQGCLPGKVYFGGNEGEFCHACGAG